MSSLRLDVPDNFVWGNQPLYLKAEDDSSSEDEKVTKKHKNKKVKASVTIDEKKIEEHLSKINNFDPTSPAYEDLDTVDECDRLVTAFPNSSKAWLLYVTYHLKQAEVDKARNIAEKALKTISFREEKEKYNVWAALLNLENLYGTRESLMQVFERALTFNDQKCIYSHLADLYIKFQKTEEAEQILETMVKKYKVDKDIWIKFITFCMQNGKPEKARKLLERSLQTLIRKFHADVMGKMAHLEYQHGDLQRSKLLFENIIQDFPKRKDLLSIYITILKKMGDETEVQRLSSVLTKK